MTNTHRDILSTQKTLARQVRAMTVGFGYTRESRNPGEKQRPCDG